MKVRVSLILGVGAVCLLAAIICFAGQGLFLWFMGGQRDYGRGDPPAGEDEGGGYLFDPKTILQASNPAEALRPGPGLPTKVKIMDEVAWSENDYYRIALAAVPSGWHGDLNLEFIQYDLSCQNLAGTPQDMLYTFFNGEKDSNGRLIFSELRIGVYPTDGQILWLLQRFFRHPDRGLPPKIDLAHLKITSKDALRIAEANGGSQYRQEAHGDCKILFTLGYGSWDIGYSGAIGDFQIDIDASAGKTKIIRRR